MEKKIELDENYKTLLQDIEQFLLSVTEGYELCQEKGIVDKLRKEDPELYEGWIDNARRGLNQSKGTLRPVKKLFPELTKIMKQLDEKGEFKDLNLQNEIEAIKEERGEYVYKYLACCVYRMAEKEKDDIDIIPEFVFAAY